MSQITIQRLGLHGDGIADGPIYVPLTLPQEVVEGDVDGNQLHNMKIITPSDERVKPGKRCFDAGGAWATAVDRDAGTPGRTSWRGA